MAQRHSSWRRWLTIVGSTLLAGYSLILVLLMFFEEALIFFPDRHPVGHWQTKGLSYPVEDARFQAADGTQLHGWYVPHEQPRAYVLFSHGNGGNLTNRYEMLGRLHRLGLTVLIYDYRGYGRSDDRPPNEPGILQDARAARGWLAERHGVAETEIVHLGESLGGGVAVDLAAADGAQGGDLAQPVYVTPRHRRHALPALASAANNAQPAGLPLQNRPLPWAGAGGPRRHRHAHPARTGRRLHDAAPGPKRFINLPGYGHNEDPPEFYQAVDEFIESLGKP